jgi:hypothetical protein
MGINNVDEKFQKKSEELHSRTNRNEVRISEILDAIKNRANDNSSSYSDDELNSLTKEQQNELLDELLDKAPNLTGEDKRILNFLVNKKN